MQSPENSNDSDIKALKSGLHYPQRKASDGSRPAYNRIDLVGQVFSALTVLAYHSTNKRKSLWVCRCECGNEAIVSGVRLRSRKTRSCGCLQKYCRSQHYYRTAGKYDLTGKSFGRLTVVRKTERPPGTKIGAFWECLCDCGETKVINSHRLIGGASTSCGCARRQFLNAKREGEAAENSVLALYRKSAALRKHPYLLTDEECSQLIRGHCHYCGCGPKNTKVAKSYNGRFYYNGIDRIDNSKGYEMTNVVTCCIDCNRAKRQMGYQEFLDWVARVYRHVVAPVKAKTPTTAPLTLF